MTYEKKCHIFAYKLQEQYFFQQFVTLSCSLQKHPIRDYTLCSKSFIIKLSIHPQRKIYSPEIAHIPFMLLDYIVFTNYIHEPLHDSVFILCHHINLILSS